MLNGVDPAVDDLDGLVQDHECGLQAGQLDQHLDRSGVRLPASLDLLASFAQARELEVVDVVLGERLELRQEHARHVLLLRPYAEASILDRFLHLEGHVAASSIRHLGQGECCDLHDAAHLPFGLVYSLEDFCHLLDESRQQG